MKTKNAKLKKNVGSAIAMDAWQRALKAHQLTLSNECLRALADFTTYVTFLVMNLKKDDCLERIGNVCHATSQEERVIEALWIKGRRDMEQVDKRCTVCQRRRSLCGYCWPHARREYRAGRLKLPDESPDRVEMKIVPCSIGTCRRTFAVPVDALNDVHYCWQHQ